MFVVNDLFFSVAHVTDVSGVVVENLTKDGVLGKVSVHKCKESPTDILTE